MNAGIKERLLPDDLLYVLEELALADSHTAMVAFLLSNPQIAQILWREARRATR
jgi:hypothetical protein